MTAVAENVGPWKTTAYSILMIEAKGPASCTAGSGLASKPRLDKSDIPGLEPGGKDPPPPRIIPEVMDRIHILAARLRAPGHLMFDQTDDIHAHVLIIQHCIQAEWRGTLGLLCLQL